jgi:hypothetical protein
MRSTLPILVAASLLASAVSLTGCVRGRASESPKEEIRDANAGSPEKQEATAAARVPGSCEEERINDDLVRVRNTVRDYSFVAILPPLQLECEEVDEIRVRNHDGLVEWTVTAIGEREALDAGAFLEALWRKNEAASGPRRRVFGGGLEVTPEGQVVLSYLALTPGPSGEAVASVVFVNLRQREDGDAFLMRMVAQVEPDGDPELTRARMRGPFMPLFDEFQLGEPVGR